MTPEQQFDEAKRLFDDEEWQQAAILCNRVLEVAEHPLVINLLGMCLLKMDKREFAERVLYEGLSLKPDCVPIMANLGNMMREDLRIKQARDFLEAAIRIQPDNYQVNHNMSVLCLETGRFEDGLRYSKRARELAPDNQAIRHTYSLACLQNGDYVGGCQHYEARKGVFLREAVELPKYEGGSGKVIIRQEQGFGDTLMVSRWLPKLREMGAEPTLVAPNALYGLMEESGLCSVMRDGDSVDDFTHHLWTMDLMCMFGTDWSAVDGSAYFKANPVLVDKWDKMLGERKKPRIGFCYSGKSRIENFHAFIIDKRRSLTISEAHSLMNGIDAQWVNLTRETGLPDSTDFSAQVADFSDMAGLLRNLDLVVTVDTALCHLAGGLGVPTMVLHRHDTCWRWWPYTDETPLYQNMRHFYQPEPFNWVDVIEEVRNAIQSKFDD